MDLLQILTNVSELWSKYWQLFLFEGVKNTLILTLIAVTLGVLLGTLVAMAKMSRFWPLQANCLWDEKKLLLHDGLGGALISAGTAVDADISVDLELAVALSDSLDGALIGTSAAGDASIGNSVSHDISSHKYCSQPQV